MSGSQSQLGGAPPGSGADPSMEDILASIRRILSEEDTHSGKPATSTGDEPANDVGSESGARMPHAAEQPQDVLLLDSSMLVRDAPPRPESRAPAPAAYQGGAAIPAPPVVMPFSQPGGSSSAPPPGFAAPPVVAPPVVEMMPPSHERTMPAAPDVPSPFAEPADALPHPGRFETPPAPVL